MIMYLTDLAAWQDVCRRASVKGAIPIQFRVLEDMSGVEVAILAEMIVPDSKTGELQRIASTQRAPRMREESDRVDFLRRMAHWLYRHEVDEQFDVFGTRPFFPHHEHAEE